MMMKPLFGALAAATLLAACASDAPPPRPMAQAPAQPVAAPPAMPTGDGRVASMNFADMSGDLTESGRGNLGPVVDRLMANPNSRVMITTYSARGDMPMARTRGQAVRQALIDRGVPANRIRVMNAGMMRGADGNAVQVQVR